METRLLAALVRKLLALSLLATALVAQPDPTALNVEEVNIDKTNIERLDVHKSHPVKVTEIWKLVDGFWVKVWELGQTGGYKVSRQSGKISEIEKADGTDFTKDDKYRIVIEPSDSDGDSTEIEKVTQHTQ